MLFFFYLIVSFPFGLTPKILPVAGCFSMVFFLNIFAKTKLSYLFAFFLIILTTLNAYVAFTYSSYVSSSIIAVMLESNVDEIKSAMGGLIIPVIILLAISSFLIISSVKELKKSTLSIKKSILAILLFIAILTIATYRQIHIFTDFRVEYSKAPFNTFSRAMNRYCSFFYGNIMVISSYLYDIYLFNSYVNGEKEMPEGIGLSNDKTAITKIFLIIGESATPEHMSIFGYDKPTTPFLDSLHNEADQIITHYGRGIASQTKNAVPGIVSSNSPIDSKKYWHEYSVIELAKKNNYASYWLSNQNTSGLWNGRDAISAIAGQADYTSFWKGDKLQDDFILIDQVKSYYREDKSKQLFILHIQGSHFLYADRYDDIDEQKLPGEATLELHYDRSIHHTDRFLEKLYTFVKKNDSAILIYVSDHGQEIQEMFGHRVGTATKKQFQTPIVALNNSSLSIDSILSKYQSLNDSIISNNSVSLILSEIIGYSVSPEAIKESVENGEFVLHGDDNVYRYSELE